MMRINCGEVKLGAVVLKVLVEQMQQQCDTGSSPYAAYLWCRPHVTFLDRVVVQNTLSKILNGRHSTQISDLGSLKLCMKSVETPNEE
jgi:hypothetical protein